MRQRALTGLAAAALLTLAACGGDDDDDADRSRPSRPTATDDGRPSGRHRSTDRDRRRRPRPAARPPAVTTVVAGDAVPRRPLRGQRGGRHDHATCPASTSPRRRRSSTSSSPTQAGYYDDLCLDVELTPSFSTANYPLIAGGEAEIASGGSFSEVVDFATANDVELVAVDVEGRAAIDSLIVKPGTADRRSRTSPARRSASRARSRRASRRCSPAPGSSRAPTTRRCCSTASTRSPTTTSTASSGSPATRATSRASSSGPGSPFDAVRPDRVRRARLVRRAVHDARVGRGQPDRAAGLPAGDDARPRRRPRRSGGGDADGRRPRRGQRQPELPVARGRVVPLGDRLRSCCQEQTPRTATTACPTSPPCRRSSTPTPPSASSAAPRPTPPQFVLVDPIAGVYDGTEVIWPS